MSDWKDKVESILDGRTEKVAEISLADRTVHYSDKIVSGRVLDVLTGPEEVTRAFLIDRLVNEFGYQPERIELEHEYTAGRPHTITSRIDVIVRDANGDAFLFIEVKQPDDYNTIDKDSVIEEQLFKLAGMERTEGHGVRYLVLYTLSPSTMKDECIIIDSESYSTFSEWETVRDYTNSIPARYGKAQREPYKKGGPKDLETEFTNEMLSQLQVKLHNVLWGGGGTDDNEVFASLVNLILAKIQDEDEKENGQTYDFQSLMFEDTSGEEFESNEVLFDRINLLYRRALKEKMHILDEGELQKSFVVDTKKFTLSKLKFAVSQLEGLSFVDGKNSLSGKDILGDFFEGIIRSGFKQTKGQFFTHINIVRFMLWALQTDRLAISRIKNDKEIPYVIDPSAGSGTFLIEYMKFITKNMKYRFRKELGDSRAVKDKIESDWFYPNHRENKWAQTYIYGSEINFNLGTATKVNMILHGDGSTNIFVKDGLAPFMKYEKETAPNALKHSESDAIYGNLSVNKQFDLILTNPPFSVELDNDTKRTIKKDFLFGDKKNSENLFIERWYQLLREKGRVAAVLPESVFDTSDNKYIRIFLFKYFKIKAVVSLPQLAFEPFTSTKTSLLFAQKKEKSEVDEWDRLWKQYGTEWAQLKTRIEDYRKYFVSSGRLNSRWPQDVRDDITNNNTANIQNNIKRYLKDYWAPEDDRLQIKDVLVKYSDELDALGKYDSDTSVFGFYNAWWVFGEVSKESSINYPVFMAEADNVGYKRTTRGIVDMPNDLYDLEYAPLTLDKTQVNNDFDAKIAELNTNLASLTTEKGALESKAKRTMAETNRLKRVSRQITQLQDGIQKIQNEKLQANEVLDKYYTGGTLKEEYQERTDPSLIYAFNRGVLAQYKSEDVVLRKNETKTILDSIRKAVTWE